MFLYYKRMKLLFVLCMIQSTVAFLCKSTSTPRFGVVSTKKPNTSLFAAKYKTMEEILAKFPEDLPVLINFYDAKTEDAIKSDIVRAKNLLKDRCTLVSIKQQDYPEIAKLWDANEKTPSMILFKDGKPICRLYEESHYLEIVAKIGQYCRE